MAYCSPADLHSLGGVPRGATPNPGRHLASAVDDTCTLDVHGFETGDAIMLRAVGSGALPAGLSEGVTYYAQAESEHTFKLRATAEGTALSFTDADPDDGPIMVIAPIDRAADIEWADRTIDEMVPGQAIPFDDTALYPDGVPQIIRITSAELAGWRGAARTGSASRSLAEVVKDAQLRLERWAKGLPVRRTPDASRQNLAAVAVATATDPKGWKEFGGL